MKKYKFVGTHEDEKGNVLTTTEYIFAIDEKDAVNCFLRDFKPNNCQWEFLGKV